MNTTHSGVSWTGQFQDHREKNNWQQVKWSEFLPSPQQHASPPRPVVKGGVSCASRSPFMSKRSVYREKATTAVFNIGVITTILLVFITVSSLGITPAAAAPSPINTFTNSQASSDSTVTSTTLTDSQVYSSTVTRTTLTSSKVTGCYLTDCTFTGSTVTNSKVTRTTLTGCTVHNSTITDSTLTNKSVINQIIDHDKVVN